MIKVKDGYAKLIGTTYSGSASRVLLSNGGDHVLGNASGNIPLNNGTVSTNLNADMLDGLHIHTGRNSEANKVVRTDASGYILAGWINTTSGDMGTTAATRIYCSNDGYIRYKTPANFFSVLTNSSNLLSITVGDQNRKVTVAYATNAGSASNADTVDSLHSYAFKKTWEAHAGKTYIGWVTIAKWTISTASHFSPRPFMLSIYRSYNSPASESYTFSISFGWDTAHITQISGNAKDRIIEKLRIAKCSDNKTYRLEMYVNTSYTTYDNTCTCVAYGYYDSNFSATPVCELTANVASTLAEITTASNYIVGNLSGTATRATQVTVTNSDSNASYRMVWHSGNSLYSTAGIYCNPSSDSLFANFMELGRTTDHGLKVGTIRGTAVGSLTGLYIHLYERVHIGSPNGWGSNSAPANGLSTYGAAWLATNSGSVGIGTTSPSSKLHVSGGTLKITNNSNTMTIGSQNTSWGHIENSANVNFYFNRSIHVDGDIWRYNTNYGIASGGWFHAKGVYANRSGSSTDGGVSLYSNSDPMTYGIAFRGTSTYGTHGYVTADWATYLTMNDLNSRGWIFRRGSTNVASIDSSGLLYTNGRINGNYFTSRAATGTQPYACTSTTLNTNLNADLLDGVHASGLFTNLSNSGNNISITIGGTNKTLTPAYASSAGNADTLDNYHRKGLYSSIPAWINANAYTVTVTVSGSADTYYPVVISTPTDKEFPGYISVWKNLSTPTASYSGNHSNGTSSMWLFYEVRNWYWDGNGGYLKCWYYSMPYATLCAKAEAAGSGVGKLVVYLRGGGTLYKVSSTYGATATVYTASTNIGSSSSPVNVAPTTSIGNRGQLSTVYLGYGNISGSSGSVRDAGNSTAITLKYSSGGFTSNPSYLAAWDGYQITRVAPSYVTVGSATNATNIYVNLHTGNNIEYPLVWSNLNNTNSALSNQLYKSYSHLTYNPNGQRITAGLYRATTGHFSSDTTLYVNSASASSIIFRIGGTERVRIALPNGYLGVGTSGPTARLHVAGDSKFTDTVHVYADSTGNYTEGIRLYGTAKDSTWSNILFGCDPAATSGTHANQWLLGRDNSNRFVLRNNTSDKIYVTTAGNMGVGVVPSVKLHVAGTVYGGEYRILYGGTAGNYGRFYVSTRGTASATEGTAGTTGVSYLMIGNETAVSSTAGSGADNALGILRIYGSSTGYTNIRTGTNNGSGYTLYLPGDNGLFVYHTNDTAVGNATTPVYVTAGGKITACTSYTSALDGRYVKKAGDTMTGHLSSNAGYTIIQPYGAQYNTSTSSVTGCITVVLPASIGNTMVSMWIDVYVYSTQQSFSVHCGGYTYNNSTWANSPFAMVYGANHRVRMGHNGTNFVIYIGEISTVWSYPQVSVRNVTLGYSPTIANWQKAWDVVFSTSVSNVTYDTTTYAWTTKNLTKSSIGLGNVQNTAFYKRVVTVNGSGWDMAGTVNSAAFTIFAPTTAGTSNYILKSNGSGAPTWIALSSITAGSANWLNVNSTLTYGASGLNYFNINGTAGNTKANNTPTSAWYHVLRMNHANSGGYLADIAVPLNDVGGIWWRQIRNGAFYGWYKLLDNNNSAVSGGGSSGGSSITVNLGGTSKTLTIPTSLPANGGTSSYTNYLKIHDVRGTNHLPNSTTYPEKYVTAWFNSTGTPDSSWYAGLTFRGWSSGYAAWQLCSYSSTGTANNYNLYFRNGNSSWGSWKTILDSSNSSVSGGGSSWDSSITVKINGTSKTLTIPSAPTSVSGNAGSATKVYINNSSGNNVYPVIFTNTASCGTPRNDSLYVDTASGAGYNPNTNAFVASVMTAGTHNSTSTLYLDSAASTSIIIRPGGTELARFLKDNGYLGLGVTSPSYRLHVSGTGYFTSGINVNSKVVIDSTGRLTPASTSVRNAGVYGVYDSYKVGHVWSMGTSYAIPADGSNTGNMYGLVYFHTNWSNSSTYNDASKTEVATYASGHLIAMVSNGSITASLGTYIWSRNGFKKNGSSDSYVLLGGGGHKTIASFQTTYDGRYVLKSGDTMTGNLTVPQVNGNLNGSIVSSAPQLAASSENNNINIVNNANGAITTNAPQSLASITKAIRFRWYDTYWQIGNIRSGSTGSDGFGVTYGNSNLCFRVTTSNCYVGSNTVLHSGNSSVSGGGSSWSSSITVKINGTSKTLTIPSAPTSVSGSAGYTYRLAASSISNVNAPNWQEPGIRVDTYTSSASNKPYSGNNANGVINFSFGKHGTSGHYGFLLAHGNGSNRLYFNQWTGGSTSGWKTVAWTSDIPTVPVVTNYYWANIKVSASSNTATQPTFSKVTISYNSYPGLQITRSGSTNGALIGFSNSNGVLGGIGMTSTANGGLKRYTADYNTAYTVCDTGNTSFTRSLTSGTKIGTLKIAGTDYVLYCLTNTNTDTLVSQSLTTTANYRPVVLGYASNATAGSTALYATHTNVTYTTNTIYAKPSTGDLYATSFYTSSKACIKSDSRTSEHIYFYVNSKATLVATDAEIRPGVSLSGIANVGSSSYKWNVVYANKWGTSTIGGSTKGVYLNGGTITAMTYSLGATVNSGTANKLAYYSGANTIDDYTSTIGASYYPIYLNGGVPTRCFYKEWGYCSFANGSTGSLTVYQFGPIVVILGYITKIGIGGSSTTVFTLPSGTPSPTTKVGFCVVQAGSLDYDRNTVLAINGYSSTCYYLSDYDNTHPNGVLYPISFCYITAGTP